MERRKETDSKVEERNNQAQKKRKESRPSARMDCDWETEMIGNRELDVEGKNWDGGAGMV